MSKSTTINPTLYIANAFSVNMLIGMECGMMKGVVFEKVTLGRARELVNCNKEIISSAVGHVDTAAVISSLLETQIPVNRISVKLVPGSYLLLGQFSGARLPEGCTTLPQDATIDWYLVTTN